jgi:hypothetical protein
MKQPNRFSHISKTYPNAYSFYKLACNDDIKDEDERLLDWLNREGCVFSITHVPHEDVYNIVVRYKKEDENGLTKEQEGFGSYYEAFNESIYGCMSVLEFKFKPKPEDALWIDCITVGAHKRKLVKEFWKSPKGLAILNKKRK